MKKNLLTAICLLCIVFSAAAKPTHQLVKIIQSSPTGFILYCINPCDCPNCYIGYQLVKRDVEPYFSNTYWLFPGNVDSADVMYFMKLHFNFSPSPSNVFFDDSLYRQYCPGQAAICIINKGKILWSSTLHDLQFGDYPKIQNDSDRVVLLQQRDVSKFVKNPSDKFCLINDSLAIAYNSLRDEIYSVNIKSGKSIKIISTIDSLFIEHLIPLLPLSKSEIDTNLKFFHSPTSIFKKYYRTPMGVNHFQYNGKNVWIGISINALFLEHNSSGKEDSDFMPYGFFLKCNDSLTNIEKIYAMTEPRKNDHWDTDGLWANNFDFSIIDSNSIYLPILPYKGIWLGKYLLNDVNKRVEIMQPYKMNLPDEIPKKYNGMNIGYTASIKNGFQGSVFMFDGGVDIYKFYDSTKQINLNPELPKWADKNGVNAIADYEYLPAKQQAFVVLCKQEMSAQTAPVDYYYCFLDKEYKSIESKPIFFANDVQFLDAPDGTLQVIAKENGVYTLKIYKVF